MCGLIGYFAPNNHFKYVGDLQAAINKLLHRGPDYHNAWQDEGVGLGHTRLSILDLSSAGNQPMISYDGRYVIIFNGQVYNYVEIAKSLQTPIEAHSDTRVILEAIAQFGLDAAIPLFNGMFSFVVWDQHEKKLHLARDSIGIKPLYWARTKDGYLFGSEIKALRSFSEFNTAISKQGAASYFSRLAIYGPDTIYENCYKLLPGHILTIEKSGVTLKSFTPKVRDYTAIKSLEEADYNFKILLEESVAHHSRSDVPFSAFLSGGIDSSLIVSLLSQNFNIKTYSIGYEEKNFDESKRAKKIAAYLGVSHDTVLLSPESVRTALDNIADIYDEPFADSSCLPTYLLSREVAKHTKIAFSGDGADELFAGYPRYFNAAAQWKKFGFIPYSARNAVFKKLIPAPSSLINQLAGLLLSDPQRSLPYLRKVLGYKTILDLFYGENSLSLPATAFVKEFKGQCHYYNTAQDGNRATTSLRLLLQQDQCYRLPDEMLTKVDRASMAHSLEVRVPFLDNELVAFSRALPDRFLGSEGTPKILLRRLLAKYIPQELYEGPKVGFHIPLKIWLKEYYKEWAEELLFTSSSHEPFNLKILKELWIRYCNGEEQLFYPLWSAIIYKQWLRKFKF